MQSFGDIGCGDVCLLPDLMELDGTRLFFCEQLHVGTFYFLIERKQLWYILLQKESSSYMKLITTRCVGYLQ